MDSVKALHEAIEIIRNGIDDDMLMCDHGLAQEVIAQLEKLLMYCELCGDERVASDLNEDQRCPPCQEREERNEGEDGE